MSIKSPDPTDIIIGERVRSLRLQRGLSQTNLADKIGVTFQQVQKYEKGVNRIGGGRLVRIAAILGVDISALMDGAGELGRDRAQGRTPDPVHALGQDRNGVRLARAFAAIKGKQARQTVVLVAEVFAATERKKAS